MKKTNEKLISLVMTAMFTFSITAGIGGKKVNAEEATKDKYKTLLLQEYENISDSLKQNSKLAEKYGTNLEDGKKSLKYDPNELIRVIVQLDQKPVAEKLKDATVKTNGVKQIENSISAVKDGQRDVISDVEKLTGQKIRRSYGYLLNGFSISAKRKDIGKIEALDGVKKVTEARVYYPDLKFAHDITQAYSTWSDLGFKGEGMVVSIIDTGIDFNHKDLKVTDKSKDKLNENKVAAALLNHGKFFTDKVPYGYNYADCNENIIDSGVGDMHGMHVAGIVAANGDEKDIPTFQAVKGVAPEAQLLAMKVFSNNAELKGAWDDDIVAAIEDSVKLGADVINMSLGSTAGFQDKDDPQQKAVNNAVAQGVAMVISAGNSAVSTTDDGWASPQKNLLGLTDTSTVGDPGLSEDSLCVASYENTNKVVGEMLASYTGTIQKIGLLPGSGSMETTLKDSYELVECGLGKTEDFKGKILTNKIALIQRGGITFAEKINAAKAAGATGVIVYNKSTEKGIPAMGGLEEVTLPSVSISYDDGVKLIGLIAQGVKVSFTGKLLGNINENIGEMSQYSSWGPTPNLEFKPEITAPGGDIYSLANNNKYQSMSGTSMSSPYTAGSEALIMQAVKKNLGLTGTELVKFSKNTTMNTAYTIMDKANNIAYSPRRQGAGMLQIEKAIKNNVILTDKNGKASVALHEIGKDTTFELNLKNYGDKPITYTVANGGILTDAKSEAIKAVSLEKDGAAMKFDTNSVTVPAKGTAKINVTINLGDNVEAQQFVEGYVKFNSSDDKVPSLSIPYLGFYGNWSSMDIVDQPLWNDNTIAGETSLGYKGKGGSFVPYGTTLNKDNKFAILEENIAISQGKTIYPKLYMLRNSKELKVQILDKDKKVLTTLDTENKIRKNVLEDVISEKEGPREITGAKWDGSLYNPTSGKYEIVPDGQYYYRIIAKADLTNASEQIIEMKVKVDNVAPKVNITSNEASAKNYTVTWAATDELSGINNAMAIIDVNGVTKVISYKDGFIGKDNNYAYNITLENDRENIITLGMLDNAGNMGITQKTITLGKASPVNFTTDTPTTTNKATYKFAGYVKENVKELKINNELVKIDNSLKFSKDVNLIQGDNKISVVATDKDNKEVFNNNYTISCDSTAPQIKITQPEISVDKIVYTDKDKITIKGSATDSNLKAITVNDVSASFNNSTGDFEAEVPVSSITTVTIKATDTFGNETLEKITVVSSVCNDPLKVTFGNLTGLQIINNEDAKNPIVDGNYKIKGYVNKVPKEFKIDGKDVTVNKDLTFSYDYKLQQGTNKVRVYAKDTNDKVTCDYAYRLIYDNQLPTLKISEPVPDKDGKIYVTRNRINIKGTMTDNTYGYSLYINGNSVYSIDRFPVIDPTAITKDFSYNLKVKNGDKITIELVDEFGNNAEPFVFGVVITDTVAPNKPLVTLDNESLTNKPVTVTLAHDKSDTDVELLQYSLDQKVWLDYSVPFTIDSNKVIYARAIDFAGNISDVTTKEITNIDMVKPNITVKNIENNKFYDNSVKPEIIIDKANVEKKITLDGELYDGTSEINIIGNHTLYVSATDKAGNKSEISINFTIQAAITSDPGSVEKAAEAVKAAKTEIVPVGNNTGILSQEFVNAIKDSGKKVQITFNIKDNNNNNMTVSFTAAAKDLKPLDFTLNKVAPNNDTIFKIDKNAQIISFKENGVLPADTVIRIKVDASKIDITKDIFFYYYNPTTKKTEQIGEALKVDKDGYVTLTIKHCSDYFLSNSNNTQITAAVTKLVKTGSMIDTNIMLAFGTILASLGALFMVVKRKEQH